ncbi:MAG TPA: ABC transporter ATP-binding protein [Planctomycetota bacterium]|nr:ABC transporter ATP-binding protein [Planctomycetota bacterium]
MAETPAIETRDLTKRYRHPIFPWIVRALALTRLNLRVEQGEVFGLLGPNGSGKSTTIKLLLGLIFPTTGTATVLGGSPRDLAAKRRLGYVPEETRLHSFLSAEETLHFHGRLFGLSRAERRKRANALLDFAGLSSERNRPVGHFSKGMQRRVAVAQCLINDPDLVILDEPTTGMDPLGRAEVKDLIRLLKGHGKTVLLSSHHLSDIESVCDRVTILYGGMEQVTGDVASLLGKEKLRRVSATMGDDTLEAVKAAIRAREGSNAVIEVGPAEERLERFFLDVVKKAQEKRLDTSGSGASRGTLDFITRKVPVAAPPPASS